MKKRIRTLFQSRHVMITVMLIIGFCIFIFWGIQKTFGENKIIDLNGNNAYWKASLNISLGYNSELIIQPRRDDFFIPSEINTTIIADGETIYSADLQYIPHENNPRLLGRYITYFDSRNFKGNEKEIILNISYNDNDISILLK